MMRSESESESLYTEQSVKELQANLKNVLFKTDYCCICYKSGCSINLMKTVDSAKALTKMDQLILMFGEKIQKVFTNELLCDQCNKDLDSMYKFYKKVEDSAKLMTHFINQISSKVDHLMNSMNDSTGDSIVLIMDWPSDVSKKKIEDESNEYTRFDNNKMHECKEKQVLVKYHVELKQSLTDQPNISEDGSSFETIEEQNVQKTEQHNICPYCSKIFTQLNECQIHLKKCKTNKRTVFQCKDCKKKFATKKSCNSHYYTKHIPKERENAVPTTAGKLYRCYLCPADFRRNKDLLEHLSTKHHPHEKYNCNCCSSVYDNRVAFIRHIYSYGHLKRANPNQELPFKCKNCPKSFGSAVEIESHVNNTHTNQRPYSCYKCGKRFAALVHLERHEARHDGVQRYECSYCHKRFTEKTGLKGHTMRFHNIESMPVTCELCGRKFVSLYQCKLHQQRMHSTRNFVCPICASLYPTIVNLKIHVKKVHLKKLSIVEYMNEKGYLKELEELFKDRRTLSKQ